MLASSVLPMLMDPKVRKGVSKLAKYALVLGGLGVGILAFIIISKKFKPFKSISDWLKKGVSSPLGAIGGMLNPLGAVGGMLGVPSFEQIGKGIQEGVSKFQKDVSGLGKDVAKGWTGFWGDVGKNVSEFQKGVAGKLKVEDQKRRELRRIGKPISRELGNLEKLKSLAGISAVKRMSALKTGFKKLKKRPMKDLAKQFERSFEEKRRKEMGKKIGVKVGKGIGAKMAAKWAAKWRG